MKFGITDGGGFITYRTYDRVICVGRNPPRVSRFFCLGCKMGQAKRSPTKCFRGFLVGLRFACPTLRPN
jgi:hypothetical protein